MGIIDLLLSADNLNDLIAVIQHLEIIQNKNSDANHLCWTLAAF